MKRQKMEFLDLKFLFFSGIFLSGIGRYPPPPLSGKICYVVFDRLSNWLMHKKELTLKHVITRTCF